jgi:ADP-ribosylglycohydrolase
MLIQKDRLRQLLLRTLSGRLSQGCDIDESSFTARIEAAANSYDGLYELALELRDPPSRADWPWVEPVNWDDIVAESTHLRPQQYWSQPDLAQAAGRARAGFLGSVCGCVLGKPVEINPTLAELKQAGQGAGEWPISDYISEALLERLGRRHDSWPQTTRGNIEFVAADDDIHYTIIGMLLLEAHGPDFGADDLYRLWGANIPPLWTWGPERSALLGVALNGHHFFPETSVDDCHDVLLLNPGDEMCGALIRADAYGYACPGNPDLAAWLAWKDASFTHTRTGVYGAMFVAALIALCHCADSDLRGNERLDLVEEALQRIPAKSRLAGVLRDALDKVAASADWELGYAAVHGQYRQYTHCEVYQEIGTLLNTLKFATSVDHGICLQVSQGNDTDSFGATAGSILGVLFGPGALDDRWIAPFNGTILHGLSDFHEHKLDRLADRMADLPARVYSCLYPT